MANVNGRDKGKMTPQAEGYTAAVPIGTGRLIRLWDRNSRARKMASWLLSHLLSHTRTFWRACYTKLLLCVRNRNRCRRGIGKCDSPWTQGVYTWGTWKQNRQGKARCLNAKQIYKQQSFATGKILPGIHRGAVHEDLCMPGQPDLLPPLSQLGFLRTLWKLWIYTWTLFLGTNFT